MKNLGICTTMSTKRTWAFDYRTHQQIRRRSTNRFKLMLSVFPHPDLVKSLLSSFLLRGTLLFKFSEATRNYPFKILFIRISTKVVRSVQDGGIHHQEMASFDHSLDYYGVIAKTTPLPTPNDATTGKYYQDKSLSLSEYTP